jgi:hypothetical protein
MEKGDLMKPSADPKVLPAGVKAADIDAGLLLARLESRLINGENPNQIRALLRKEALWRRLGPEDRLRWADLAQMAEETETTCVILDSINREYPSCKEAWQRHLELLSILGRDKARAALVARARPHIGKTADDYHQWLNSKQADGPSEEKDISAAVAPFYRHGHHVALLSRFLSLFGGREECFARQWADREKKKTGYVPERRPLTLEDLEEHLSGRKTYGIYLMKADGRIQTAVIDADLKKELRGLTLKTSDRERIRREAVHMISRVKELSRAAGAAPLVEFSGGKGYHFWYFFKTPEDCEPIRKALAELVRQVMPDLTVFNLEIFPKQDHPGGKGFGNLVKLPLGLHRGTGKRSFFLDCRNRSMDAQLNLLLAAAYSSAQKMSDRLMNRDPAQVVIHPKWKAWAAAYPDLYRLQSACAPLAQIMSLCLDGGSIALREEKILYQTVGFLPDGRRLLHYLMAGLTDYNPHQVDYRLSRLRGTPLGCRRIHELSGYTGSFCRFVRQAAYPHPLLHIDGWREPPVPPSEKVVDLNSALKGLQTAIMQVQRFIQ